MPGLPVGDQPDAAEPRQRLAADWTKLQATGLGWVDFHTVRRTHSTLMNEIHDDPKLVADQLGHTLDVNQNVYTRASIARRKKAVDAGDAK